MKLFIRVLPALLLAGGMAVAQTPETLPGALPMAEALHQRLHYVNESADEELVDAIRRDLREADRNLKRPEATEAEKNTALAQREAASQKLLEVLASCPRIVAVSIAGEPGPLPPMSPLNLPGDTGAVLFRVEQGEGPVQCISRTYDLSVDAGMRFPVDVRETGTTWVLAVLERVPQGRTSLQFRFEGASKERRTMDFETVTLPTGMANIQVLSDDTGAETPCMMRLVWKMDDREIRPANAEDFGLLFDKQGNASGHRGANLPGKLKERYWCVPGPFEMALAPGDYEVMVLRGVEHVPVCETFTVQSGQTVSRTYRPRRWVNMSERGWFSGDDHVHTQMLSDRDARMVMHWIQAEDVRLANVVKMGDIYRTWFEQRGFGKAFRVEDQGYILSPGQECPRTHEELGHTLSMNIQRLVRDTDQYYLYDTIFDEVHRQGGLTGYAHVNSGIFQVHRDMSINIPKGKVDFVELLQFADLGTSLYYEFLDLGFKVTASSGSDVPWGGSIGEGRVYAYLGRQAFSADRWFEAVRRGNTFVTNGLMLDFTVDGKLPGDTLHVSNDRPLRVKARAWGDARRELPAKLDIIVHGNPVKTVVPVQPNEAVLEADFTLPPAHGFWIAARAEGRDGSLAHTTPVYVAVKGLRFWNHGRVAELIAKREASLDEIGRIVSEAQLGRNSRGQSDTGRPVTELAEQGPALLERVEQARKIYAELRATAEQEAALRH